MYKHTHTHMYTHTHPHPQPPHPHAACSLGQQQSRALEGELDAYRRSIVREQEKNEALTLQLKRAQLDALNSTKLIAKSRARQEALQAEYSTYARTLTETERRHANLQVVRREADGALCS